MRLHRSSAILAILAAMTLPPTARGGVYFVAPDGKGANRATQESPWPLDKANAEAQAGDTVVLLDGTYSQPIAPAHSGAAGKPITFQALHAGQAIFEGGPFARCEAITLSGRSYVAIDAVTVRNARRFLFAEGEQTHHITIDHCRFETASQGSWESCRFRGVGDAIHVCNCLLTGGNDLLAITGGQQHLVEHNFFGDASHTGLVLIMVQRSVVRGNTFTNRQGKMMEVFSTREVPQPHRLSEYNLIEDNLFDTTAGSGIQYAGNRSILRRNIFRRCMVGMAWANYLGRAKTPEAWYDRGNRFYHNVLCDCGPGRATLQALAASGIKPSEGISDGRGVAMEFATNLIPPSHYGDERCVNNILYRNAGLGPQPAGSARPQISFTWDATPGFGLFFHNDICADAPGAPVIFWIDAPRQKPPGKQDMTLREWQERYPRQAAGNIEADPQFVDPEKGDYHLQPTSPCIAAGGALTTVAADSGGTIVKVADALFFTDGYGIPGVEGDLLRLGARTARVVNVNYQTNELTVDQALTCQAGTPVNLSFVGSGPDIGAFQRK